MPPTLELGFDGRGETPANEVRVKVTAGGRLIGTVFFRSRSMPLRPSGDALLCMGLVPAMEVGSNLRVLADVDRELLANAREIQKLLCSWYADYRPIGIEAGSCDRQYPAGRGSGVFFSGGIDSSYSLAEARPRLDALITIIGADVSVSDTKQGERLSAMATRVADGYDLEPVIIETNVREVLRPFLGWIEYHGSAMACIRHLLADSFENVLIASSGDETSWACPWGSHPGLDPLFGTHGARIEHHGLNHRLAKVERILHQPALMQELRVCNKEDHNCGVCGKCRLTMCCLSVLDGFGKAPTFPADKEHAPNRFHVIDDATRSDMVHLRAAAALTGRHQRLVEDIDRAISHYDRSKARRRLLRMADFPRRLKRAKRRLRYWRASR